MDTLECIKTRRSIRKFLDLPLPRDILTNIVDAGRYAPSSGNLQDWKFVVVLKPDLIKKVAEACLQQYWMESAAAIVIVCSEPEKNKRFYGLRGERLYTIQDCAASAQNILLTAHSLGVGACWVGAFDEDMIKRTFGIPDEVRPQAIIALGYADEKVPVPPKYPIEIVFYFNRWRGRIEDVDKYLGYTSVKIAQGVEKGKELAKKAGASLSEKGRALASKLKSHLKEKLRRRKK